MFMHLYIIIAYAYGHRIVAMRMYAKLDNLGGFYCLTLNGVDLIDTYIISILIWK